MISPTHNIESDPIGDDHEAWKLTQEVINFRERFEATGHLKARLGVTWKNLTVEVLAGEAAVHENVLSQANLLRRLKESRHQPARRTILDNSHGCVKPGEMLLVLGRPGSGCTTLLKMLANRRDGYAAVTGDVHFGSMTAAEAASYRGHIIMNTEEETFYPSLTVKQTMDFATRLRIPSNLPEGVNPEDYRLEALSFLARSMGIEHTLETRVGDAFVRGVSGGERKRVSIIECLNSRASLFCWDNSTRGLDASSALDYVKAIRTISDVLGLTTIVTLYQAGNAIYDLFDKVLVLDSGKQVFYGPREVAKPFMEQLGFECENGANIADFLTSVTVPTERKIRPDFAHRFPRNAEDLLEQYIGSPIRTQMETEYGYPALETTRATTRQFQESVILSKDASLPAASPMTVGILAQTKACVIRQYQIVWGDKFTLYTKQFMTVAQALIAGSLYYQAPPDSSGLFLKAGAAYFALLFNSLLAMTEVTDSFFGRPVLTKHKAFAYFHPAAFCFAQVVSDIPVVIFQVTNFSIILYFMVGLRHTVAAFFTFWAHLILATLCFTALFRAIGACFKTVDGACKTAGFVVGAVTVYSGYIVQTSEMHPWFGWLFWINPFAYSFDALLSNEFYDRTIPCAGYNLIPSGPSYEDDRFQACAGVKGAKVGKPYVTGADYLSALSYGESHIWRNFGIVFAWWVLFVAITVVATTRWRSVAMQGSRLVVPREKIDQKLRGRHADVESGTIGEKDKSRTTETLVMGETTSSASSIGGEQVFQNTSIFTWKNLTYTVKTPSGERILLDNVQGWVKPGMLGALMGASGAGKTTLLDVLAQRKTEGTIRGSILVDGRPLAVSFQRSAGYCEQLDVHEPYATVREALEFSALLRQSRNTPREEKLNYVDTIIDLLELQDLADTLIGQVGAGLSVEQRKRVTIGVELVAKPAVLIFLDEPTSGLDGQSAYNTVRFLRKLANAGQSVLVTIHQPSAQLFTQFDTLLLLAKGGKTAYFGDIGPHAATLKSYFARYGAACPTNVNPADHMIDVISGGLSQQKDWAEVWKSSPEHQAVTIELNRITEEGLTKPCNLTATEDFEFAAPLWEQVKIVSQRANTSLFRNTDYVNNKIELHIILGLFNGFTFWMVGDSFTELQARLFTIFNFIFVAPGAIAQLQPLFIDNRDVFEAREKKSKTYSWIAFVVGLIVSEFPYLVLSAILYFLCWYYTVGFPNTSDRAVGTLIIMICYEFIYTGIGQFIAAYSPNALTATLVNPLILGSLVATCGILVPYSQITAFWRYWLYWLNPFTYILGGMLTFASWGQEVRCKENELAVFNPPDGVTCGDYLENFLRDGFSNLLNSNATSQCKVCPYRSGSDYMISLNLNEYYYSWRDVALTALFAITSYLFVFVLMKLRTKASTKAE